MSEKINQLIIKYRAIIKSAVLDPVFGEELITADELKIIISVFKLCEHLENVKMAVDSHFHDLPQELKDLNPEKELIQYRGIVQQIIDI